MKGADKAIILFSDGEDQDSSPIKAARSAAKKNVRVYSIGMGSAAGAPVPNKNGGFKKKTDTVL